jgi:hypothetical protein
MEHGHRDMHALQLIAEDLDRVNVLNYCRQLTSCFAKTHTVADAFDRYDVKKTPSRRLKESVVPK